MEPEGSGRAVFKAEAIIDVESGDDTLVRCEVTDGSFGEGNRLLYRSRFRPASESRKPQPASVGDWDQRLR